MADDPPSGSRLRVSVVDAEGRPLSARRLASWLASIAPRRARGAVTIAVVSDSHVRRLNRRYRGIDRPTDVLSFPASGSASHEPPATKHLLGDIVIARGVAHRQARRARHSAATEWRILALHGLLHLLGYDHEHDGGRMERVERRLRRKGGLPPALIERSVPA
jgi:probable rRNA maturation factor